MKYIIFENNTAVIFSDTTSHKSIAGERPVRSAGFCSVETYRNEWDDIRANISVWGYSSTLKKKSDPEDALILKEMFRMGG